MCVCVFVCVLVCACDVSALELYEKSEFVFAERSLSCRNTDVLASIHAHGSRQCMCVFLCLRACLYVIACSCVCLCVCARDISRHVGIFRHARFVVNLLLRVNNTKLWNYTRNQNSFSLIIRAWIGALGMFKTYVMSFWL